jgi:hypothetical protein
LKDWNKKPSNWDSKVEEFESKHGCAKPIFIGLAFFGLLLLLFLYGSYQHYKSFMAECLEDGRKQYECSALYQGVYTDWRAK